MIPIQHVDIIINGILMGGIYSLIAVGLNLIYGVTRVLNLAHGDFLMLGSVVTYFVYLLFGHTPLLSLIILLPLFFLVGGMISSSLIKRLLRQGLERALGASVVVTLGLSFIIVDLTLFGMAQGGISTFGVAYSIPSFRILNLYLPTTRLLSLALIVVVTIVLRLFITRTFTGKTIRALSQNREAALALGADESKISFITFGLGVALAAIAGLFVILITAVTAGIGMGLTFKALIIIVLGGMGSFIGAIVGALILGLAESYTMLYIGGEWTPVIGVIILVAILVTRPQGLFGRVE